MRETEDYQPTLFSKNQGRIQLVLRLSTLNFKEPFMNTGQSICVHHVYINMVVVNK